MVDKKKRDFLQLATGVAGAVGVTAIAIAFTKQFQPNSLLENNKTIDINVSEIHPGMSLTTRWAGKPIFIRNRLPEEVIEAKKVDISILKDKFARNANLPVTSLAIDINRSAGEGKENWLVLIAICTHLGCLPIGETGEYGGWLCPCHNSQFDSVGRVRAGPASENLHIPPYKFIGDDIIRIG
ncbi:ubiquinol-cytochrome c reductase iron-sulfur subunit [Bartonella sp. DGB1]|uniref:ubiquinol-cytochrome c reductase iron-sulfur subunit n=1 Tax=Bartonella sp. DGB1 TaxID=3239807 RepID=UPI0035249D24